MIIPGVGSSPESTLESIVSLDFAAGRPRPSLTWTKRKSEGEEKHGTLALRSLGPGPGVDTLEAGPPPDFDAGPGVLEAGPPAGGRDDFLFSPGFAGVGDGAAGAAAAGK